MSLSGVGLLGWYERTCMSHNHSSYYILHYILTGPNGEPKITHGNTLVSDLLLEEVVKTIDVSIIPYNANHLRWKSFVVFVD